MNSIINIQKIISSDSASTPEAGDKVYVRLKEEIDYRNKSSSHSTLIIDFTEIINLTSAFLNNALGKLFEHYSEEILIKVLEFKGVKTMDDFNIIKLTINNAIMMSKYHKKYSDNEEIKNN